MPQTKAPRASTAKAKAGGASKQAKAATARKAASPAAAPDALALLQADHREVEQLFARFEEAEGDAEKRQLAIDICCALKVHARLEEDVFYPAAYDAIDDADLLDEAEVEHASARDLIAQIEAGAPGEALFDAKVMVLAEYIHHHVSEEEGEIFPRCRDSKLDLALLGQRLAVRKQELTIGFTVSNPVLSLPS